MKKILLALGSGVVAITSIATVTTIGIVGNKASNNETNLNSNSVNKEGAVTADTSTNSDTPAIGAGNGFDWHDWDEELANADRDPDVWYKNYATPTYKEYDHVAAYEHAKLNGWTSEEYQKFLRYIHEKTRSADASSFGVEVVDSSTWIGVHWGMDDSRFDTFIQGSDSAPLWTNAFKEGYVGENQNQLDAHNASSTWHAYTGGAANFWLFDSNNYENAWLRLLDQKRLIPVDSATIRNDDSYLTDPNDETTRVVRNSYMVDGEMVDDLPLGKSFFYVSTTGSDFVRDYNGWKVIVTDTDKEAVYSEVLNPAPEELMYDLSALGIEFKTEGVGVIDEITTTASDTFTWGAAEQAASPMYNSWKIDVNTSLFDSSNEHLSASFKSIENIDGGVDNGFNLDSIQKDGTWLTSGSTGAPFTYTLPSAVVGTLTITPDANYQFNGNGIGQAVDIPVTLGNLGAFRAFSAIEYLYYAGGWQGYGGNLDLSWTKIPETKTYSDSVNGILEKAPKRNPVYVDYDEHVVYNEQPEFSIAQIQADPDRDLDLDLDSSFWTGKYIMTNKETGDSAMDALDKMVQADWYSFPMQFNNSTERENQYGRMEAAQYWDGRVYSWAFVEDGNGGYKLWKDANVFGVEITTTDRFSDMVIEYTTPQVLYGSFTHVFITKTIWENSSYYTTNPW